MRTCGKRQLYQHLRFYQTYPQILRSLTAQLQHLVPEGITGIQGKVRSATAISCIDPQLLLQRLSYTHIEHLVAIDDDTKRTFYEVECIRANWSVREEEGQEQSGTLMVKSIPKTLGTGQPESNAVISGTKKEKWPG